MNSSLSAKRTNIERSHLFALGLPNMLKNAQYMPQNVLPLLGRVRALSSPWPGCMQPIAMGLEASTGPPATLGEDWRQHSRSPLPAPVPVLGKGSSCSTFPSSGRALHLPCPQLHTSAGIKAPGVWVCTPRTSSTPCLEQSTSISEALSDVTDVGIFKMFIYLLLYFFRVRYADNTMHF